MELTMGERKAVMKRLALEYRKASKADNGQILDQICGLNGWHRNHARKALAQALVLKEVKAGPPASALWGGGDEGLAVLLGGSGHAVLPVAGRGAGGPDAQVAAIW